MPNPQQRKPRIFVGCSEEAVDRSILDIVVEALKDFSDPHPWTADVGSTEPVLGDLLRSAALCDYGLFIYCNDDAITNKEGVSRLAVRDNVVLETGIFLGTGGQDFTVILAESKVSVPTDMQGKSLPVFSGKDKDLRDSLVAAVKKLKPRIKKQGHRNPTLQWHLPENSESIYGLRDVIEHDQRARANSATRILQFYNRGQTTVGSANFYSNASSMMAYVGGLKSVQSRFWTTTTLESAFWSNSNKVDVLAANRQMLEQVKAADGSVRRLFILDEPLEIISLVLEDTVTAYRKQGLDKKIDALQERYAELHKIVSQQIKDGFEVRIASCGDFHMRLPEDMTFHPSEHELAIFDDSRVDAYRTSSSGDIVEVRAYTGMTTDFSVYLQRSTEYFESLWDTGEPVVEAILTLVNAIDHARNRIDYRSYWLSHYEQDYDKKDSELKLLELSRVKEVIRASGKTYKTFLDVGTCTARYPIELYEFVADDGLIIGIDDDIDCIDFTKEKLRVLSEKGEDISRISVERGDFLAERMPSALDGRQFDLMTCMLGTISHFGEPRRQQSKDEMYRSTAKRMRKLAATGARLFIGNWSDRAISSSGLLAIYLEEDRKKLQKWTLSSTSLAKLFEEHGFIIEDTYNLEGGIDLICMIAK